MSNSFTWLRNMLDAGVGNYFDIMNYHDYNAWWTLPAHYDSVQNILNQYGLSKPIWITETAISSFNLSSITPSYASANEQAADVWRRLSLLWGKGAEVVLWHSNWSSGDMNAWGEFGLVSNNGIKKKSFHSYKLLNEKISDFTSANILSLGTVTDNNTLGGNGIWVVHFVVNGNNKWVMWSPDNQPYTLNGLSSSYLKVTEIVPNRLLNGGDSAVFVNNINSVNGNSYVFSQLPSLPILVEEETNITGVKNEIIDNFTFVIYPIPAQNIITLEVNFSLNKAEISISNIIGENLLVLQNVSGNQLNILLDKFPKGMYFLTVNYNNMISTKKFMLQ